MTIFLGTMHGKWMPTRFGSERETVIEDLRNDGLFGGATWAEGLRVDANYNAIIDDFLVSKASHLLMLNDDMGYPRHLGERLLLNEKDIVGGLYFSREGHWEALPHWYAYMGLGQDRYNQPIRSYMPMVDETLTALDTLDPVRIDATGTWCLLIARPVLEEMAPPWFQTEGGTAGDLMFFWKARQAGFEVWGDPRVVCQHFTPTNVGVDAFKARVHGIQFQEAIRG